MHLLGLCSAADEHPVDDNIILTEVRACMRHQLKTNA